LPLRDGGSIDASLAVPSPMTDEDLQACLASRPKGAPRVDDFSIRRVPEPRPSPTRSPYRSAA